MFLRLRHIAAIAPTNPVRVRFVVRRLRRRRKATRSPCSSGFACGLARLVPTAAAVDGWRPDRGSPEPGASSGGSEFSGGY